MLNRFLEPERSVGIAPARERHRRPAGVQVHEKSTSGPKGLIVRMSDNDNAVVRPVTRNTSMVVETSGG